MIDFMHERLHKVNITREELISQKSPNFRSWPTDLIVQELQFI